MASLRRPSDALFLLRVGGVAALVPALLRLPLPWVSSLLSPRRRPDGVAVSGRYDVDRLVVALDTARVAGHPVIRSGCLTRAVTLYWFLSRGGLPVELCFGLATDQADPVGHAWLSLDGRPFLESDDPTPRFTVTYRIGETGT